MKKYKIGGWRWSFSSRIQVIEVERETDNSVWEDGRRLAKVTDGHEIHDTWEEAHARLTEIAEKKLENARRALDLAQGFVGNVKGLKKPQEAA
jgi:hypothetical protein